MDSFQGIYTAVRRITWPVVLRQVEVLFYFIFIALSFISFILPFALEVNKATFYIVGALSVLYAFGLYFLRFKINITFGLISHFIVFLLFSSFIIFDCGLFEMGLVFVGIAVIGIFVIVLLCGLGHRVSASGANEPPVNRAWPEIYNQDNVDAQVGNQIELNPWRFNGDANHPDVQDGVNPEILNNDVADPQIDVNDNVDPQVQNN